MAEFRISVGVAGAEAINRMVYAGVFPRLTQAVGAVAQQARINWMQKIAAAKLWEGEKKPYMASVQWQMTGPFSALVWSDYRYAEEIETGRPARDLKRMLDTSPKVRRTQAGKRFLVIPFRHNVGNMPREVYAEASQLQASTIVGQGKRRSGEITTAAIGAGMFPAPKSVQKASPYLSNPSTRAPMMVRRNVYQWGGRLAAGMLGPNPKGKVDRYAGMVRFDTSTPKAKSSAYLTFRVMIEGSSGWIVPAKPGLFLARDVASELQGKSGEVFAEAIKRDLA